MRILIHSLYFAPDELGVPKYTGELAAWLAQRGHSVRVVTAPPFYPQWKLRTGYSGWKYKRERWNGVDVWRCPLWIPARPSGPRRVLHYLSFVLGSVPSMLLQMVWRPAVVVAIAPTIACAPLAWLVGRLSGSRTWLHIQDFEVDAAFEAGLLSSHKGRAFALRLERMLLALFDRVSSISPAMIEKLKARVADGRGVVMFPNWVDSRQIYPLPRHSLMRAECGIPETSTVILYAGSMGEKQGLEILLEAARCLQGDARLRFVMCGDGPVKGRLMSSHADLLNVKWLPIQPVEKLNELLNMADIHAMSQIDDVANSVMPSKLTGMLSSGRPVVAVANKGSTVYDVVSQCGIAVLPGDMDALTSAMIQLAVDVELRSRLGAAARRYAEENLASEAILSRFEEAVIDLVGRGGR